MTFNPFRAFSSKPTGDYVVLLHGLARNRLAMLSLQRSLASADYHVINIGYPSRHHSIETLTTEFLAPKISRFCADSNKKIHFVTHSMGGILTRNYLATHILPNLGRVVMLAPPNQGSEVVDILQHNPLFRRFFGPAGQQLTTGEGSIIQQLPNINYEVGIIAGSSSWRGLFYFLPEGANDGTITVESTKLNGMKEHIILPVSHTFIMENRKVIQLVRSFLASGSFIIQ